MAQALMDDFGRHAGGQFQGGIAVPQVMDSDHWQLGRSKEPTKLLVEGRPPRRRPVFCGEHLAPLIEPRNALVGGVYLLLKLAQPMFS